jgi:hypothetical protein
MIKYSTKNVHDQKIDQWIKLNVNVMLVGEHGTGKTQRILEGFKRNNLKYAYFSGATIDPWLHLIGVPEITGDALNRAIDFILPRNITEDIEAIFVDEYNRSPKIVRNALLELQQFKTINGRKFPKLKLVWAAINPPKGEDEEGFQYDVDEPDPAQVDRFHMIVEIPSIPDPKYFKKRFGNYIGGILIKWWRKQAKDARSSVPPRRLEYVGDLFFKGADLTDILPPCCNVANLIEALSEKVETAMLKKILKDHNSTEAKDFLSDPSNFYKVQDDMADPIYFPAYKHCSDEILIATLSSNEAFERFVLANAVSNKSPKHWTRKLVKIGGLTKTLSDVKSVLTEDWGEAFAVADVDIKTCKVPLSKSDGDWDKSYEEYKEGLASGNYPLPDGFKDGVISSFESKSFANTYWHKRVLYWFAKCHKLEEAPVVINILLSMYNSLKAQTMKEFNGFDKIFNKVFLESYNRLSNGDKVKASRLFNKLMPKHGHYDLIAKLISGANNTYVGALPKEVDELVRMILESRVEKSKK